MKDWNYVGPPGCCNKEAVGENVLMTKGMKQDKILMAPRRLLK